LEVAAAPAPDAGPRDVPLRLPALRGLPGRRSVLRSARDRQGHRQTKLHHGRVRGVPAADPTRADVDGRHGPPARVRALEASPPPGLLARRAGRRALRRAGEIGPAPAADLRRRAGGAARHSDVADVEADPGADAAGVTSGCGDVTTSRVIAAVLHTNGSMPV